MKVMRKIYILILIILSLTLPSFAVDFVLPREKKSIVNTNYALFVGRAKRGEILKINDESIYIAPNGAFAHSVKLNEGENRIIVKSNFNSYVYKFYKNAPAKNIKPETEEFEPKLMTVIDDNTPLRRTPIDWGMNRMSHLFKDTKLIINAQQGDFYRVNLSKDRVGWIAKNSVKECPEELDTPQFINLKDETFKNASVHTLKFTENLPYTIDENDKEIIFKVYNPLNSDNSVYTINIKKYDRYYYKVLLKDGEYTLKITQLPYFDSSSFEDLTIVIDPGHGGSELGAIGCLGDKEKDINLKIAEELKEILVQNGINAIMTRECDGFISLNDRVKIAEKNNAQIFVSIHLDSIPDIKMHIHKNRGTTVYYYNPNSKELAKCVESAVTETVNTRKNGTRTASFAVIRPTDYVGILVETAYMTNPLDSVIYKNADFPYNAAMGIYKGIVNYLSEGGK